MTIAPPILESRGDDTELHDDLIVEDNDNYLLISFADKEDENFLPFDDHEGGLISGWGESNENCGKYSSSWMSENKEVRHKRTNCHRQGCPLCFRLWAIRQAEKSAAYLTRVVTFTGEYLSHWTFSPEVFTSWKQMESDLFQVLSKYYVWSKLVLSVVRHPRSIKCRYCGHSPSTHKLPMNCPECDAVNPWWWYWHPHLHLITNFHYAQTRVNEYVEDEKQYHYILKQIRIIKDEKQLRVVLAYEFGHAEYVPLSHSPAIRYFAFSAKTHFRIDFKYSKEDVLDSKEKPFYLLDSDFCEVLKNGNLEIGVKVTYKKDLYTGQKQIPYYWYPGGGMKKLTKTTFTCEVVQTSRYDELLHKWIRCVESREKKREREKNRDEHSVKFGYNKEYLILPDSRVRFNV